MATERFGGTPRGILAGKQRSIGRTGTEPGTRRIFFVPARNLPFQAHQADLFVPARILGGESESQRRF